MTTGHPGRHGPGQLDFSVVGYFRTPGGHWVPFTAQAPAPRFQGDYLGMDWDERSVRVSVHGTRIHDFTVEGVGTFPEARETRHGWRETCSDAGLCFSGSFKNTTTLVGTWRTRGGNWTPWEAHAYWR